MTLRTVASGNKLIVQSLLDSECRIRRDLRGLRCPIHLHKTNAAGESVKALLNHTERPAVLTYQYVWRLNHEAPQDRTGHPSSSIPVVQDDHLYLAKQDLLLYRSSRVIEWPVRVLDERNN